MLSFSPIHNTCICSNVPNDRRILTIVLSVMTNNTITAITRIITFIFWNVISLPILKFIYISHCDCRKAKRILAAITKHLDKSGFAVNRCTFGGTA